MPRLFHADKLERDGQQAPVSVFLIVVILLRWLTAVLAGGEGVGGARLFNYSTKM